MTTSAVLALLAALAAVFGAVDARAVTHHVEYGGATVLVTVLSSFLVFYWYRLDSEARLYRRTALLNVGIVMFAIAAVPYYLVRSRPSGQKLRALLRLAGFGLVLAVATFVGAIACALVA